MVVTSRVREFFQDSAVRDTLILPAGLIVGAFFSYLLQFFLGRFLSVEDYGTFNALLSLSYLVGIPMGVLGTSLTKTVSELLAGNKFEHLTKLFQRLSVILTLLGIVTFGAFHAFARPIGSYLNIPDTFLLSLFGAFLGASYLGTIPSSYLQGLLRFRSYAFFTVVGSAIRLVLPIVFIYFGLRLYGTFYGFIGSGICLYFLGYVLLRRNLVSFSGVTIRPYYKKLLTFSFSVLFVISGMMLLNNLDVLMVKRYFESTMVGYYAGTVTLGKILLFGAGSVTTIMFPQVAKAYTQKENVLALLRKFLLFQGIFILGGLVAFSVFPGLITRLFFGERFAASIAYLPRFAIFISLYVLINFMVMFFLALEKTKISLFLIPAVVVQFILLSVFHSGLYDVININIGVSSVILLMFLVYLKRIYVGLNHSSGLPAGKDNS